jgi:hypothetical protein
LGFGVEFPIALFDAARPLVPGKRGADMVGASALACRDSNLNRNSGQMFPGPARKRPGFSSKVYPGIEEARFAAWRALLWFRAKIGGSPEVSTLWLDQILKGGEKLQIFFASKIVNEPLSTT